MYPEVVDKEKVGTYEAKAFAGGVMFGMKCLTNRLTIA